MKKLISILLLICAITLCIISCGNDSTSETNYPNDSNKNDVNYPNNSSTNNNQNSETVVEKLSASCDAILCSGYDKSGNYYELVGTQKETSTSFEIKVGVIKNNKWLMPLSSNSCFISDDGLIHTTYEGDDLYAAAHRIQYNDNQIEFIDIGGFLLEKHYYGSSYWEHLEETVILNCNTKSHMTISSEYCLEAGTSYNEESNCYEIYTDNGKIIAVTNVNADYNHDWYLIDVNTLKLTNIAYNVSFQPHPYCYLSEGVIFADDRCFYDTSLNKVLDLNVMNIYLGESKYWRVVFENGTCTFKTKNSIGNYFIVTIDHQGNVISEEKTFGY